MATVCGPQKVEMSTSHGNEAPELSNKDQDDADGQSHELDEDNIGERVRGPETDGFWNTNITAAIVFTKCENMENDKSFLCSDYDLYSHYWRHVKNHRIPDTCGSLKSFLADTLSSYVKENVRILMDQSLEKVYEAVAQLDALDSESRCLFLFYGIDLKDVSIFKEYANKDMFAFFSGEETVRKHGPGFLTTCLLAPTWISVMWELRQLSGVCNVQSWSIDEIRGNGSCSLPFSFEVERLLRCLVKAMAYESMKTADMFNFFYRDAKVGKLFTHYCLAQRIASKSGFIVKCYPEFPDLSRHSLWDYFDLFLDKVLMKLNNMDAIRKDMVDFLSDALLTCETALDIKESPLETAFLPMMLCEASLHGRVIEFMVNFLDSNDSNLKLGLCYGLLPILLSIPVSKETQLLLPIGYLVAKLLCFTVGADDFKPFACSGYSIVEPLLTASGESKFHLILALMIMISGLQVDCDEELRNITQKVFQKIIGSIEFPDELVQFMSLLFLDEYISHIESGDIFSEPIGRSLLLASVAESDKVRAAFLLAFGSLVSRDRRNLAEHFVTWLELLKNSEDISGLLGVCELCAAAHVLTAAEKCASNELVGAVKERTWAQLTALADNMNYNLPSSHTVPKSFLDLKDQVAQVMLADLCREFLATQFSKMSDCAVPNISIEEVIH